MRRASSGSPAVSPLASYASSPAAIVLGGRVTSVDEATPPAGIVDVDQATALKRSATWPGGTGPSYLSWLTWTPRDIGSLDRQRPASVRTPITVLTAGIVGPSLVSPTEDPGA
jgi:hypothetical protein